MRHPTFGIRFNPGVWLFTRPLSEGHSFSLAMWDGCISPLLVSVTNRKYDNQLAVDEVGIWESITNYGQLLI